MRVCTPAESGEIMMKGGPSFPVVKKACLGPLSVAVPSTFVPSSSVSVPVIVKPELICAGAATSAMKRTGWSAGEGSEVLFRRSVVVVVSC